MKYKKLILTPKQLIIYLFNKIKRKLFLKKELYWTGKLHLTHDPYKSSK